MTAEQPVILGEMPSLSKLYLNAAAQAARRRLLGAHDTFNLPSESHEVRGVGVDEGFAGAEEAHFSRVGADVERAGRLLDRQPQVMAQE